VVHFDNLGSLLGEHVSPEVFHASSTVNKDNELDVAVLLLVWVDIMAAVANTFASVKLTVGTSNFLDLVLSPSLGSCHRN
jgi:hypothetical protein